MERVQHFLPKQPLGLRARALCRNDKPGQAEKRPLSIPAVRDRVVQAALKITASRSRAGCN
jgi:hypothetical protein